MIYNFYKNNTRYTLSRSQFVFAMLSNLLLKLLSKCKIRVTKSLNYVSARNENIRFIFKQYITAKIRKATLSKLPNISKNKNQQNCSSLI